MLKMYYFFTTLALLLSTTVFGQQAFKVVEQTSAMSKGSHSCLTLELMGSDMKIVNKSWAKFSKKYKGKTKFDKKANESFTDDAVIKDMSDNTVDMYASVTPKGEVTQIAVWFNLGVTYLSSKDHPERYPAAEKLVIDFGYYVSADLIAAELKLKEKELKNEEKELKKIEKVRTKYEKKIEKYKAIIAKAETGIGEQEAEIEKNNEIENEQLDEIKETKKEIEDFKQLLQETKQRLKK